MQIIDDNGKVFGKVNIIDLTILIIIILGILLFITKLNGNSEIDLGPSGVEKKVKIVLEIQKVRDKTIDSIKIGDVVYEFNSLTSFGTIEDIKIENAKMPATVDKDGNVVTPEIPDIFNLYLTINATGIESEKDFKVNNNIVKIGVSKAFDTNKIRTSGIVVGFEPIE